MTDHETLHNLIAILRKYANDWPHKGDSELHNELFDDLSDLQLKVGMEAKPPRTATTTIDKADAHDLIEELMQVDSNTSNFMVYNNMYRVVRDWLKKHGAESC